jgi:two-component system, NarL family, response regulator NreC
VSPPTQIQRERTSRSEKIRCVLVHDHVLLRQGLRRLLEDEPDLEVVAEAGNAAEALQRVFEHQPEVVIADSGSFAGETEQTERLILRASPHSKVLFLTPYGGEAAAREMLADSSSCAPRHTSAEELVGLVRRALAGEGALREMPRKAARSAEGPVMRKRALTTREREVLELLAEGRTVRSVAETLGLSVKTVDAHKFNLMRKLGVHNKAELVMWAIQKRVVKLPANF